MNEWLILTEKYLSDLKLLMHKPPDAVYYWINGLQYWIEQFKLGKVK